MTFPRLAKFLLRKLIPGRAPDVIIGTPPYLLRWHLIPRNPFINIYLHRFLRDDDDRAMHDHPWPSVSLALAGKMRELFLRNGQDCERNVMPGDVVARRARHTHRMVLLVGPAWTLFITGPRIRAWGFHCKRGHGTSAVYRWVHWRDFTAPGPHGESTIGKGCD